MPKEFLSDAVLLSHLRQWEEAFPHSVLACAAQCAGPGVVVTPANPTLFTQEARQRHAADKVMLQMADKAQVGSFVLPKVMTLASVCCLVC